MSEAVFPLVPRRRLIGLPFGEMRSARRGLGSDVASTRPYQAGDDMSKIDWAASARLSSAKASDEFVVREHFADESPRVVAAADRRPQMALGPPPRRRLSKARALRNALKLIGDSAIAARSLLGYLDHGAVEACWRPPAEHQLEPLDSPRPFSAPPDALSRALDHLGGQRRDLPTGTFLFALSDFLAPPGQREWMRALEHGWDVVPVVIQDPVWERSFPDVAGLVVAVADPDTGAVRHVRLTRREAAGRRETHEARWARLLGDFRSLGLEPVVLPSGDPGEIASAFRRWADERIYVRGRA